MIRNKHLFIICKGSFNLRWKNERRSVISPSSRQSSVKYRNKTGVLVKMRFNFPCDLMNLFLKFSFPHYCCMILITAVTTGSHSQETGKWQIKRDSIVHPFRFAGFGWHWCSDIRRGDYYAVRRMKSLKWCYDAGTVTFRKEKASRECPSRSDLQVWSPLEGQTACLLPPLERELWSRSVDWVRLQDSSRTLSDNVYGMVWYAEYDLSCWS